MTTIGPIESDMLYAVTMRWTVLVLVVFAAGCNSLCDGAVSYCSGETLNRCISAHDEDDHWETKTCPAYCVELAHGAICAADPTPRPACEGAAQYARICDGAQQITSTQGYADVKLECADPGLCEETLYYCTVRPGPQTQCMARTRLTDPFEYAASYCDGDSYIRCDGDFAISETACLPGWCLQTAQTAGCKQSLDPDPACTSVNSIYPYSICVGNASVMCLGAYRIGSYGCFSGTCVPVSGGCRG